MGFHRLATYQPRSARSRIAVLAAFGLLVSLGIIHKSEATVRDTPGAATDAPDDTFQPQGAIEDNYLVILRDGAVAASEVKATAARLAARHDGTVHRTWETALLGFEATIDRTDAMLLAADPAVAFVEQNRIVSITDTQDDPPSFGLDRIDQDERPLDGAFTFSTTASNVHAYIIDTGIRFTHREFDGRAESGFDSVDGGAATDCNGHGTHVAGTVGGSTFGVAKEVTLVGVRVLDCEGLGSTADVVAGVNFVTREAIKPAVANMSIGGEFESRSLDAAVRNSIASGIPYVVAAGNVDDDACQFSPASVQGVVAVGATDRADRRASFSNTGSCVDIFAPGVKITSATAESNTASDALSGTSMASPHVAGAVALLLADNAEFTPAQVQEALLAAASEGVVRNRGAGSPNRLLRIESQ